MINHNLTFQNVLDLQDKPWNWHLLSCNFNITFQNVLDHADSPWNWQASSCHFLVRMQIPEDKRESYAKGQHLRGADAQNADRARAEIVRGNTTQ